MKEAPQFKHNTWWRGLTFYESIRGKRRHWGGTSILSSEFLYQLYKGM